MPRQPEPIDLLDLYVGAKWSVLVPESLPSRSSSSPSQDRVVELCVTDIDEPRMHEILCAFNYLYHFIKFAYTRAYIFTRTWHISVADYLNKS